MNSRKTTVSQVALAVLVAACGDVGSAPNQAPVAVGQIPAQSVVIDETDTVNVSRYFDDPDGDATLTLTYATATSDAGVASVFVTGAVVSVSAVAQGTATVKVTATDPGGLSAEQTFNVTAQVVFTIEDKGPDPFVEGEPAWITVTGSPDAEAMLRSKDAFLVVLKGNRRHVDRSAVIRSPAAVR